MPNTIQVCRKFPIPDTGNWHRSVFPAVFTLPLSVTPASFPPV
jgi:hypothetical protein